MNAGEDTRLDDLASRLNDWLEQEAVDGADAVIAIVAVLKLHNVTLQALTEAYELVRVVEFDSTVKGEA